MTGAVFMKAKDQKQPCLSPENRLDKLHDILMLEHHAATKETKTILRLSCG